MSTPIGGALAVEVMATPKYLEAATIPLYEFAELCNSERAQELIWSTMRAVYQHPTCAPDRLLPARVGIDWKTGETYFAWVDDQIDTAFIVTVSYP